MSSTTPPHIKVQTALERRILQGLVHEWQTALWVLEDTHKRRMRLPLFSLRDMHTKLGQWSAAKNEISLSRALVLNQPWGAVREVLLHEMAHQMADQVLGANGEPPHGPAFREACRHLRANPDASGPNPLYSPFEISQSTRPEDRMLRRIQKLLALAESHNRHEAEAAMAKAHDLLTRYNLGHRLDASKIAYQSIWVGTPALRHPREDYHLANLLQGYYFVQGIWVPAYVLSKAKLGRVLEISGLERNLEIAVYVHDFVCRYIDDKWSQYNRNRGLNRYRKTDFAVGVIEGFESKLQRQREQMGLKTEQRALIRGQDEALLSFMRYKHPHTRSFKRTASSHDAAIHQKGVAAGRALVIAKGITRQDTRATRLRLPSA
jgi:hypothetical protein